MACAYKRAKLNGPDQPAAGTEKGRGNMKVRGRKRGKSTRTIRRKQGTKKETIRDRWAETAGKVEGTDVESGDPSGEGNFPLVDGHGCKDRVVSFVRRNNYVLVSRFAVMTVPRSEETNK